MHILFLADNFPPEVNAPATRTFEHAREWVKAGHRVTIITSVPNFPKGKVFEGYRNRSYQEEDIEGIRVIRVWTFITANEGFLLRTLDFLSFMVAATIASLFVRKPDVVVATSPQFFTAVAGWMVGMLKRSPFIFEVRDLWPESIRTVGAMKTDILLDLMERLELFLYRKAARVVCVTSAFRDNLVCRGIDPVKIGVVTNGVDICRFQAFTRDEELFKGLGLQNKFVVGYIGTHGMAHALDTLLEAAYILKVQGRDDIHFLFIGDGASKKDLVKRAHEMGLENVCFIDIVPKSEIGRYWSLLDVTIVHLKKDPLFTTVIPSKIFDAFAMGIPILIGVDGEARQVVEGAGAGEFFTPEDAQELVRIILRLKDEPCLLDRYRQAARAAAKCYDRKHLAMSMLEELKQVAGR